MSAISAAVAALQRPGGVVLYPTETVYGLGGRAHDAASARRIAALKGREVQPLIALLAEAPPGLEGLAAALARAFWPGPVTLILPAPPPGLAVAAEILGPGGSLALRVTPHPIARALVEAVGPITSTSANAHGEPPALEVADCALAVDAGRLAPSAPSTVVDVAGARILRDGDRAEEVRALLAAHLARGGDGA